VLLSTFFFFLLLLFERNIYLKEKEKNQEHNGIDSLSYKLFHKEFQHIFYGFD